MTKLEMLFCALLGLCLVGCVGSGMNGQLVAEAVVQSLGPILGRLEGMSPEKLEMLMGTMREAIIASLPAEGGAVDWGQLGGLAVTGALTYFGVNVRRDMRRADRGEPVRAKG